MKKILIALMVFGCICVVAQSAHAQCGGKAERNRIEFKQGAHSTTVKGRLKGDEQAEYVFGAYEGQKVTIDIASSPAGAVSIEVQDPAGENFGLQSTGSKWTGTLPASGDYFMVLKISSASTSRVSYVLTLKIN